MIEYIEEGFNQELEKNAGILGKTKELLTNIAPAIGIGFGLSAGAGTVGALANLVESNIKKKQLEESYQKIIKDKEIQETVRANPRLSNEKVLKAFNVLAKFAPDVAATPEVARPFIKNTLHVGEGDVHYNEIKSLVDTQKVHEQNISSNPLTAGFKEGFRSGAPGAQQLSHFSKSIESI